MSDLGDRFSEAASELDICLDEEVELEGGVSHPLEELEELRLFLKSFMVPSLLDSLLMLYKELSKEPRQAEMYAWFVRNSQYGGECKYAQAALKEFKGTRIDRMEEVLEKALSAVRELKE